MLCLKAGASLALLFTSWAISGRSAHFSPEAQEHSNQRPDEIR